MSFEEYIDDCVTRRGWLTSDLSNLNEQLEALEAEIAATEADLQSTNDSLAVASGDFNRTVENYAERVALGVEFLNENAKGWAKPDKISLTDLELSNPRSCVLGQLAAKSALRSAGWNLDPRNLHAPDWNDFSYSDATDAFKRRDPDWNEFAHGFDWTGPAHVGAVPDYDDRTAYEILNHLWAEAVRLRRGKKKVTAEKLARAVKIQ